MSMLIDRIKHQTKILVGDQLGRALYKQYFRGKGTTASIISAFSDEAKKIGVEPNILVKPIPVKKLVPNFSLDGESEIEYRRHLLSGDNFTSSAGVFSVKNVEISFPTGIHQIGKSILKEAIPAPHLLTNPKYYYGLKAMRFIKKRSMNEGVMLTMPWHHNFYHWMIEILPRLLSFDRCLSVQDMPLIVQKSSPGFVVESLRLAGYLPKTTFLEDGAYSFKKLHLLSILSQSMDVSADAVNWLNTKLAKVPSSLISPKRVYVSRRDAKIRFVSNENQLEDVLSEFGFTTVILSKLSLADQIKIFQTAECIIGPHGAAFANLAFAKPGLTFIEFFPKGYFANCFNRISGIRKLKYGFLVGEAARMGGYSINPRNLHAILSQALNS